MEQVADSRVREIQRLHAASLLRFAMGLAGRDAQAAEDIVQETFLRAWRNLDALDPDPAQVRSWLFTVARRIAIDAARARQSRPAQVGDAPLALLSDQADPIGSFITADSVRTALRGLSLDHRQVIVELYYRGSTVRETALALGIPEGTVKSRSYHALRALRAAMRELDQM